MKYGQPLSKLCFLLLFWDMVWLYSSDLVIGLYHHTQQGIVGAYPKLHFPTSLFSFLLLAYSSVSSFTHIFKVCVWSMSFIWRTFHSKDECGFSLRFLLATASLCVQNRLRWQVVYAYDTGANTGGGATSSSSSAHQEVPPHCGASWWPFISQAHRHTYGV